MKKKRKFFLTEKLELMNVGENKEKRKITINRAWNCCRQILPSAKTNGQDCEKNQDLY